jgi:two-component system CheB/CheR fusion protein
VDHFFRSLSFDQREGVVGIVLSGTGSDGTLGVRAIKDGFGMVMVQNEHSARYAGMPSSALATGLADYVLPPSEMPQQLINYAKGLILPRPAEPAPIAGEPLQEILLLLRDRTGNDLSCHKMNTIKRRITRRMNVLQIHEPGPYILHLRENPEELDRLFAELLISVTSFFRDPEAFETLASEALPDLIRSHRGVQTFRAWVPGCATGEEAYSVAMVLVESMEKLQKKLKIQIFTTDLDAGAIETARQGIYGEGIASDVSRERLEHFFIKEGSVYRFRRDMREMLVFAPQNLIKDPPFLNMDLIVCRNLLIYLIAEMQRWVLQSFHHSLKPKGLLLLGASETVGSFSDLFTTLDAKWKIYQKLETGVQTLPAPARPTGLARIGAKDAKAHPSSYTRESRQAAQIQKLLLSRFAPCSMVVDEQGTIVYIHGRTGLYLEPAEGQPRNNVVDMACEGLKQALQGSLTRAAREKTEIVRDPVRVKTNGSHTDASLTVTPIQEPESLRGLLLVTIRPAQAAAAPAPEPGPTATGETGEEGRAKMLEQDLRYAQESLQSTIDDLQTSNEELQSTNEELETSKEEMQSLNEELTTVNAEMETKVAELARAQDDLQNLLNSTNVATVFLDERLNVKRYTEDARAVFHFMPTDIGRPLSDLASNLRHGTLMQDCRAVLKTLAAKEQGVTTLDGHHYLMRILPYRTAENVISGVVITFIDIESMTRAEISRDLFQSIVQTIHEPLVVLDETLKVLSANKAFFETFQTTPEDTVDRVIYDLGNRQWDIPSLRKLLEEILSLSVNFSDFRVDHEFPLGRRSFLLNARRLERNPGEPGMILLAFKDITGES